VLCSGMQRGARVVRLTAYQTDTQLYTYMRRFGFGEKSLVYLPGEAAGQVCPPQHWSRRTHDALAVGQAVTVTSLQLLAAYATVANGGWLMRPRLVTHVCARVTTRSSLLPRYVTGSYLPRPWRTSTPCWSAWLSAAWATRPRSRGIRQQAKWGQCRTARMAGPGPARSWLPSSGMCRRKPHNWR
jgi:hypothetical protein